MNRLTNMTHRDPAFGPTHNSEYERVLEAATVQIEQLMINMFAHAEKQIKRRGSWDAVAEMQRVHDALAEVNKGLAK